MSLVLTPLATANNPWVKILAALTAKIASTDLSFYKYCADAANFNKAPVIHSRIGTANGASYWEPVLSECPAVLISTVNTPFLDDHGAGNEQSHLTFAIVAKYELRDRDSRKALAANYELLRTIHAGYRPGTLDPLRSLCGNYEVQGDLAPTIATAGAQTTARTLFAVRFMLTNTFLG